MWDVDFQHGASPRRTSQDKLRTAGALPRRSSSGWRGANRSFVIATTRPELLAACVGVTAHPEDGRYRDLFGQGAR